VNPVKYLHFGSVLLFMLSLGCFLDGGAREELPKHPTTSPSKSDNKELPLSTFPREVFLGVFERTEDGSLTVWLRNSSDECVYPCSVENMTCECLEVQMPREIPAETQKAIVIKYRSDRGFIGGLRIKGQFTSDSGEVLGELNVLLDVVEEL
jgi:hypothetical protein